MLVAALLGLAACGSTSQAKDGDGAPEEEAPQTYDAKVRARLEVAREERVHVLRHNPTTCGCPPYELRLDGHWHRVAFDAPDEDDPALLALQEAVAADAGREAGRQYVMQGKLDSTLVTCGRGAIVVTLDPTAFGPPPEPEEEE
ncbi:MAG: hypothetical protein ACQEXJ_13135 [Myxococcota bacterium]